MCLSFPVVSTEHNSTRWNIHCMGPIAMIVIPVNWAPSSAKCLLFVVRHEAHIANTICDSRLEQINFWCCSADIGPVRSHRTGMRLARTCTRGWGINHQSLEKKQSRMKTYIDVDQAYMTNKENEFDDHRSWTKGKPTKTPPWYLSPSVAAKRGNVVPGYVWFGRVPTSQESYEKGHCKKYDISPKSLGHRKKLIFTVPSRVAPKPARPWRCHRVNHGGSKK